MGVPSTGEKGQPVNGDLFFSIFGIAEIVRLFGVTALYPGNGPLSTVAVEMLLYASYPLFLLIHKRYNVVLLVGFGLLLYFGVVIARMSGINPNHLHGIYFEFVIYWIIGAVSAGIYASQSINRNGVHAKFALLVAFVFLFYVLMINFVNVKGFHVVTTLLLAITTGGLLIVMLTMESKFSKKHTKAAGYMAVLGERSYSLYVVHTPVIFSTLWFLSEHTKLPAFTYPMLTLILVFVSTELLFRLVERPSHQYAKRWKI